MRRLSLLIPLAGCILSFVSERVLAAPTPYSTMIVFGDSLSDSGHFPDTGSGMRFTNRSGPTYRGEAYSAVAPMILGEKLSIAPGDLSPSTSPGNAFTGDPDGNNWAVGGYRTDQIFNSITKVSKVAVPQGWFLGGTVLRSRRGYLVENGFKADPKALYFISGGGNDFLDERVRNPAEAAKAAQNLADSAFALQQAGARYIMVWLLPDLGLTPAIYDTPAQAGSSYLSAVFNTELAHQLSQIDAEIIPLNVPSCSGKRSPIPPVLAWPPGTTSWPLASAVTNAQRTRSTASIARPPTQPGCCSTTRSTPPKRDNA